MLSLQTPSALGQGRPCAHWSLIHPYSLSLLSCLQENVSLIKEINELRRELKFTRSQVYDLEAALKLTKKSRPQDVPETGNVSSGQGRWTLGSRNQWQPQAGLPLASMTASPQCSLQVTSTPWPSGSLFMPHTCCPKYLWGPCPIQTWAWPKSLGLVLVLEFRLFRF